MKANEIMIGDWFRFRYTIDNREIIRTFRISRIENELGRYYVWGDGFGRMCYPERLEPIPLTPEILEKNGFKKECASLYDAFRWVDFNEKKNGGVYNDKSIKVTIYKSPICGVSVLTEIDTYSSKGDGVNKVHSCDIESVHDLQHAIRLCGIDKEITI